MSGSMNEDNNRSAYAEKYPIGHAIGSAADLISTNIRKAPSALFVTPPLGNSGATNTTPINDNSNATTATTSLNSPSPNKKEPNAFQQFLNEPPKHVGDGLLKGVLSVGNGLFQGITGVFVEPVKQAQVDGVVGFARGVGKGLTGVVLKPVAGVIDLAGKTTQGILNTPVSIYEALKDDDDLKKLATSKGKIFGVPVEESMAYAINHGITHVTTETIQYLANFVKEEGIFRISGDAQRIKSLKDQFDKGVQVTLSTDDQNYGTHEVAGLLKLYLRVLPDPLLTFERYNRFLEIQQDSCAVAAKLPRYRALLESLPPSNRALLSLLMRLLKEIAYNNNVNKMSPSNLGTVFGPSLLRTREEANDNPQLAFQEVTYSIGVVSDLINNYDQLLADLPMV